LRAATELPILLPEREQSVQLAAAVLEKGPPVVTFSEFVQTLAGCGAEQQTTSQSLLSPLQEARRWVLRQLKGSQRTALLRARQRVQHDDTSGDPVLTVNSWLEFLTDFCWPYDGVVSTQAFIAADWRSRGKVPASELFSEEVRLCRHWLESNLGSPTVVHDHAQELLAHRTKRQRRAGLLNESQWALFLSELGHKQGQVTARAFFRVLDTHSCGELPLQDLAAVERVAARHKSGPSVAPDDRRKLIHQEVQACRRWLDAAVGRAAEVQSCLEERAKSRSDKQRREGLVTVEQWAQFLTDCGWLCGSSTAKAFFEVIGVPVQGEAPIPELVRLEVVSNP